MADVLRVPLAGLAEEERELSTDQARYVVRVHRLREGDRFVAFDPETQLECDGLLLSESPARVRLSSLREAQLVAERHIVVVQCLTKGAKIDRVVRDATELGATRVVLAVAQRSIRRAPDRAQLERWRRVVIEASRQCGRGDALTIDAPIPLLTALAEHAPAASGVALLLHPEATTPLREPLDDIDAREPLTLVIGPEGGFEVEELLAARQRGYMLVHLGRFTLRTETTCAAALGAIAALAAD